MSIYVEHQQNISNALNIQRLIIKQKCFELATETVNGSPKLNEVDQVHLRFAICNIIKHI